MWSCMSDSEGVPRAVRARCVRWGWTRHVDRPTRRCLQTVSLFLMHGSPAAQQSAESQVQCSYLNLDIDRPVLALSCPALWVRRLFGSGLSLWLGAGILVLVVLRKGAEPHAFQLLLLLCYGLTGFVSDQCSALFVTSVRPTSIVCWGEL